MVERASKSVLVVTSAEGFSRKVNLLHKILKRVNRRGVKSKIIAPVNERLAKKVKDSVVIEDKDAGARFVIVDDIELLFMLNSDTIDKNYDSAVWVKSEFFTKAFKQLLDGVLK